MNTYKILPNKLFIFLALACIPLLLICSTFPSDLISTDEVIIEMNRFFGFTSFLILSVLCLILSIIFGKIKKIEEIKTEEIKQE